MKSKLSRNLLELALAHSFDACEKKTSEAISKLSFKNNKLEISSKGSFTHYLETIDVKECDEDCVFFIKTSNLLEFVKYVSSEEIFVVYDKEKKSCLLSSIDKKSKIAFQTIDDNITDNDFTDKYLISFNLPNSLDFINKLNFASRFCSNNFQDHPLTAVHCLITNDNFEIKSTNGSSFYKSKLKKDDSDEIEFYLPKKSSLVIKNIFGEKALNKVSINESSVLFESGNYKLKVFLEKCEKNSFPNQIDDWMTKAPDAEVEISVYELSKTLKFFSGITSDSSVNFIIKDTLSLESKENSLAAKEVVVTEKITGEAKSAYNPKLFLDCLDSLQTNWVKLNFIKMQDDFFLCKLTSGDTVTLLCPTIF